MSNENESEVAPRAHFEQEALVHLDALYSFALKLSRARDEAEDLVSDTVLRAFERWEQYRLGTNIRAWLFTILYHLFVSRKRRIDAREVPESDSGPGRVMRDAVGEADPEGRFYDSFLDDEIVQAIDALPDEYRAAVVLSDIQEMRYAEIAQILGIPEGTVKSRLFRGRRLLQRKLRGYAETMGYVKPFALASSSSGAARPSRGCRRSPCRTSGDGRSSSRPGTPARNADRRSGGRARADRGSTRPPRSRRPG
jgi:RNA polymerase sigma-70 factor, ECF subfamily